MKKLLPLILFFLISAITSSWSQCGPAGIATYTFNLVGMGSQGWNGNTISVIQNGNLVMTIGQDFMSGTFYTATVDLCNGEPIEIFWNDGGLNPQNISLSVENELGYLVYIKQAGEGEQGTTLFEGIADDGPYCMPPVAVIGNQGGQYINWDWSHTYWNWDNDSLESSWDIVVLPASSPAPTAEEEVGGTSEDSYVSTLAVYGETYICYVRAICQESNSVWVASEPVTAGCYGPTNLRLSGADGTTLAWDNSTNSSYWEVILQYATDTPPTAESAGEFVNNLSITFADLEFDVAYTAYVRTPCFGAMLSEWVPFTFTRYEALQTATDVYTPEQLVTSVLISNPCIEVSNVTFGTGPQLSNNGIGFFTNSNSSFPLTSGIVLSTGPVSAIGGPNSSTLGIGNQGSWPGDTDLEEIISVNSNMEMESYDATKLEFDFTASNEFMSFNFLFASEEYGTYQCNYADAFAFLLTDLETGITTNLAVVPGTDDPVSVVTIRDQAYNSFCDSENEGYFGDYFGEGEDYDSPINFNGRTNLLTAFSALTANHPYHIKMVIADRSDPEYDSAVFIEAGSFTIGPPQCIDNFELIAFVDDNANGAKDAGEDTFSYGSFIIEPNNTGDITEIYSPIGIHSLYAENMGDTFDIGYVIEPEYVPYYSVAATAFNDLSLVEGDGAQALYFPITLTNSYNDVTVSIVSVSQPRPGFNYTNKVVYKNLGVAATSGTITYNKDELVTVTAVSEIGANLNPYGFTYNFTDLQPYETREIWVTTAVPDSPTVNMDDVLSSSAAISAPANDVNLDNNTFINSEIVVNSYDPNDIAETHGTLINIDSFTQDDYLYYTIRFQNIGTANAINIRVEDLLDTQLDEQSMRMVSASHNYILERIDNKLVWTFDYIQLPGILQDEELSKGYIFFKIKVNPGFEVGDIIPNTAAIYFDNNPAVITNTFETEFTDALAAVEFSSKNIVMFPNPAKSTVSIGLQNTSDSLTKVSIHDVLGKTISTSEARGSKQVSMDVSGFSKGIYLVEVNTENNQVIFRKLVIK